MQFKRFSTIQSRVQGFEIQKNKTAIYLRYGPIVVLID